MPVIGRRAPGYAGDRPAGPTTPRQPVSSTTSEQNARTTPIAQGARIGSSALLAPSGRAGRVQRDCPTLVEMLLASVCMWCRPRRRNFACAVLLLVGLVGCGASTDQGANHALAAQMHFDDDIKWMSESEYTFCSHDGCSGHDDRHGVSVQYEVSPAAKLSVVADRFENVLQGWTRTDYCDLETGRSALDACSDPHRSYVIFSRPVGSVAFPKSVVHIERATRGQPELLGVNIDTDTSR